MHGYRSPQGKSDLESLRQFSIFSTVLCWIGLSEFPLWVGIFRQRGHFPFYDIVHYIVVNSYIICFFSHGNHSIHEITLWNDHESEISHDWNPAGPIHTDTPTPPYTWIGRPVYKAICGGMKSLLLVPSTISVRAVAGVLHDLGNTFCNWQVGKGWD